MKNRVLFGIAGAGALLMLGSTIFDAWWLTFVGAVVIGAVTRRARTTFGAPALLALLAWGVPLQGIESAYGLAPTSLALAAILGVKGATLVPVALTLIVGLMLGLSGAWLGSAGRGVFFSLRDSGPVQKLRDKRLEVKDPVLTKS